MAKYRMLIHVMVVWAAVVFWGGGTALAFTLQFGPDAPMVDDIHTTNGADVPTPQLFRVVIGHDEAASGTAFLSTAYPVAVPEMTIRMVRPAPVVQTPGPNLATSRYLRGAELSLLRQTHTVAESPEQRQGGVRD